MPLVFDRTDGLFHPEADKRGRILRDEDFRIDDNEGVQMHNAYTAGSSIDDRTSNDNAASLLA